MHIKIKIKCIPQFKKKNVFVRVNCQEFGQNVIFSVINVYNASVTHC